jgi:hypothetical protein
MSGAVAAPRKASPYERPYLDAKITDKNLTVHGLAPSTTGRVDLSLSAVGGVRELAVVRFADGYGFRDFRADITTFGQSFGQNGPSKKGLRALNHAIDNTTGYGGLFAPQGHTRRGTLLLPDDGTYVLYDDSHQLPRHAVQVTLSGSAGPQQLQATGGLVKAKTNRRFGGDDVLPAKGNITFKNVSTESPHFLALNHVKEGTTRKDVLDFFQSGAHGAPPWARKGEAGTDALSNHQTQTLHVNLPAGQYVELCFFPDPKTGMPHAFMGMIRMVHLK